MDSKFYKYQGTGNDFILFEDVSFPTYLIPQICNRNFGIGADGVLVLEPSDIADIKMRIFNQDGSEATMCGNGLRCVIRHLGKSCSIETKGGISFGEYTQDLIKVTLPKAEILQSDIILPNGLTGYLVDTGTPHLVIFADKFENLSCYRSLFGGVNVNLAIPNKNGISLRTFEKGVNEETKSCGTGGAAVSLIYFNKHKTNNIQINFPFSSLNYSLDNKKQLWMEGPAEQIFQGTISLKIFNEVH